MTKRIGTFDEFINESDIINEEWMVYQVDPKAPITVGRYERSRLNRIYFHGHFDDETKAIEYATKMGSDLNLPVSKSKR